MLHPCSELPTLESPFDAECLTYIEESYVFIERLGADDGQMGIVVKLSRKHEVVAAKIMGMAQDSIFDISISCEFEKLRRMTPIFLHTFGWLYCTEYPRDWRALIGTEPKNLNTTNGVLIQVMELASQSFSVPLIMSEFDDILFILLHGLYIANTSLGFKHNDIHAGQILLQPRPQNSDPIELSYKNVIYSFNTRFVPKLIDYGMSSTTKHFSHQAIQTNDADDLLYTFQLKLSQLVDMKIVEKYNLTEFKQFARKHRGSTIEEILDDTYFNGYQENVGSRVKEKCIGCFSTATQQLATRDSVTFCNNGCDVRFESLFNLL